MVRPARYRYKNQINVKIYDIVKYILTTFVAVSGDIILFKICQNKSSYL